MPYKYITDKDSSRPLPEGWFRSANPRTPHTAANPPIYYWNRAGENQWEFPTTVAPPANPDILDRINKFVRKENVTSSTADASRVDAKPKSTSGTSDSTGILSTAKWKLSPLSAMYMGHAVIFYAAFVLALFFTDEAVQLTMAVKPSGVAQKIVKFQFQIIGLMCLSLSGALVTVALTGPTTGQATVAGLSFTIFSASILYSILTGMAAQFGISDGHQCFWLGLFGTSAVINQLTVVDAQP